MRLPLLLLSRIYSFVCLIKNYLYTIKILKQKKAKIKVISIGNISFGGTGKTPLSIEVIEFLLKKNKKVGLVSRGYKGKWEKSGGILSNGRKIMGTWQESGDESFLIAQNLPEAGVFVGKDRFESCQKASKMDFEIVVLDDGFQHRKLFRDVDIVFVNENRDLFLREFPSSLRRADILLIHDSLKTSYLNLLKIKNKSPHIDCFKYRVIPQGIYSVGENKPFPADHFIREKTLAFCGIAKPERFLNLLHELGIKPIKSLVFPDHHPYPDSSIKKILETARQEGLSSFITTEKDAVKIRKTDLASVHSSYYLKIRMELQKDFYNLLWSMLEDLEAEKI